jgi:hypothetical protein
MDSPLTKIAISSQLSAKTDIKKPSSQAQILPRLPGKQALSLRNYP